jgi:CheY-like chemotaxis protein/HPt (histidine-containing phosphotransfer) domain-containing protein
LFEPTAREKGIELAVWVDPAIEQARRGDPTRLRQVLLNLIGNAIKFTEAGGVSVRVVPADTAGSGGGNGPEAAIAGEDLPGGQTAGHAAGHAGGHAAGHAGGHAGGHAAEQAENGRVRRVRFEVIDTGFGIDERAQANLFERFIQEDNSITRRYGGTGLGLAICRELVALMGGDIGVSSRRGAGSTFWFELNLAGALCDPARSSEASRPAPIAPSRTLRILVADDNAINQMFMVALLRKVGHIPTVVENGLQAVAEVRDGDYDVVLMDVQMPELDGIEATARIRALPSPKRAVRIIALTANAMNGAREKYLAAGMDDFVSKPVDSALLLGKLARLPAASAPAGYAEPVTVRAADGVADGAAGGASGGASGAFGDTTERSAAGAVDATGVKVTDGGEPGHYGPVFDLAQLATVSGFLRPEQLREFALLYLQDAAECAGRITMLAANGDFVEMGREAHQLVGAAGNYGAVETSRLAKALVTACRAGDEATCRRLAQLLPPATERAATWLQAWLDEPRKSTPAVLERVAVG